MGSQPCKRAFVDFAQPIRWPAGLARASPSLVFNQSGVAELTFLSTAGPDNSIDHGIQKHFVRKGIFGVAIGRSKYSRFAVLVGPEDGVFLTVYFAFRSCEHGGIRPNFFDDVQFIHGGRIVCGKALHDRVICLYDFDWIAALVIVLATCDPQKFSPIIDLSGSIRMHGAMDDDCIDTLEVRLGNALDVSFVVGVSEALVMNDHVKVFKPLGVLVEIDHGLGSFAPLVDDCPIDWNPFFLRGQLEGFALEVIIVTASAGN